MTLPDKLVAVRKVAQIRQVQRERAELDAARASARLRELYEQRREEAGAQRLRQAEWIQSLAGRLLSLPLAQAWAANIASGATLLTQIDGQIIEASRQKDETASDWRAAQARSEAADLIATDIERRMRRLREEATMNELVDRYAWGGDRP